ncbi:Uncharacterised protein [Shigella sonnei]|nr:Uncharacterised protein [Shigella sonnei]CSS80468.1 Uncharacterised protein [Shigella sonnei]
MAFQHLLQQVTLDFNIVITKRNINNTHRASGNGCAKTLDHLFTAPGIIGSGHQQHVQWFTVRPLHQISPRLIAHLKPGYTNAAFHLGSINSIYQFDHRQTCYLLLQIGK